MHELSLEDHDQLLAALLSSLAPAAAGASPERIETHSSSVILYKDHAYKIKKPVDFGFLNFATLERRRHFCAEEIRLNGRLAPQIYLDVVPITGSIAAPQLGGPGDPIEFAVRMRRFPQDALMSHLAQSGRLSIESMDALAEQIVEFHAQAARAPADSEFTKPEAVRFPVLENFEQLRPLLHGAESPAQLDRLETWSQQRYTALQSQFAARGATGWVRECHGDMHLANIAVIEGQPVIFDGIEFNDRMRWTDVLGDIGFLAMDLDDRGLESYGNRFLNRYFERSGDYATLPLLDFYRAYRAMVRAKVAALRLGQQLTAAEHEEVLAEYHSYADLAERYTQTTTPLLCITHGLSGSGKSTIAGMIVDRCGMLRVRSDVERKRLHGLSSSARSGSGINAGIYRGEATQATYARLADIAETALAAGYSVVVDAAFLRTWQRRIFAELAQRLGSAFCILDIQVPPATLRRRLAQREEQGTDASEAGLDVLEQQLLTHEPLAGEELSARLVVHPETTDIAAALGAWPAQPDGPG